MIRPATLDDIPALIALEHLCFTSDRLHAFQFRRFILRNNILLIATDQSQLIGYSLVLLRKNSAQARLYSLAVSPAHRGTNLASTLLLESERCSQKQRCKKIILEVRKDNARAIHFYKKLNYHLIGEYPNYYADHMDALRFSKNLLSTEEL